MGSIQWGEIDREQNARVYAIGYVGGCLKNGVFSVFFLYFFKYSSRPITVINNT